MEPTLENSALNEKDGNVKSLLKKTNKVVKSKKCNQCDFAYPQASYLRKHLKTHSGERTNKCKRCDFASPQAGDLREHLKTHIGEK